LKIRGSVVDPRTESRCKTFLHSCPLALFCSAQLPAFGGLPKTEIRPKFHLRADEFGDHG